MSALVPPSRGCDLPHGGGELRGRWAPPIRPYVVRLDACDLTHATRDAGDAAALPSGSHRRHRTIAMKQITSACRYSP